MSALNKHPLCLALKPAVVFVLLAQLFILRMQGAVVEIVEQTNVTIRIMSANLTGSSQKYEAPAIRIFQGLKPDIVAIQEFNYLNNTALDIRTMVNIAFGTNFYFYRETNSEYTIPNGIISRFPILNTGSWDDPEIPDRGFAWAQIDIPGDKDLYVVSVHFKANSSDSQRRAREAVTLKGLIQTNISSDSYVVVAGDLNTYSSSEPALITLLTFLSDDHIPVDTLGDPDTNLSRSERYDYILPDFSFNQNTVPMRIGNNVFPEGLVFDSRTYTPLADVAPVQQNDSVSAQHMAVIKDFKITYLYTNTISIEPIIISIEKNKGINWRGDPRLRYTIQSSTNLSKWYTITNVNSRSDYFLYTNINWQEKMKFYRITYP